jgi:hypothetical protein
MQMSCGVKVHDIKTVDESYSKFSKIQDGLKISVNPFFDKNRLIKFFGDDILSNQGILPIFIRFENQNADDGFMLKGELAALLMGKSSETGAIDLSSSSLFQSEATTYSPLVLVTPISPLIGILAALTSEAHHRNQLITSQNFKEKMLTDKIVYPGNYHSGFLYFEVGDKECVSRLEGIVISVRNIRTDELLKITVALKE